MESHTVGDVAAVRTVAVALGRRMQTTSCISSSRCLPPPPPTSPTAPASSSVSENTSIALPGRSAPVFARAMETGGGRRGRVMRENVRCSASISPPTSPTLSFPSDNEEVDSSPCRCPCSRARGCAAARIHERWLRCVRV